MLEKYSLDADECEDIDALWDSFEEFESEKIDEYYNEMTSYFKTLYAIFENQTARETRRLDFDRYPKIKEMNWAVNVMKHCKGNSYQILLILAQSLFSHQLSFLEFWKEQPLRKF